MLQGAQRESRPGAPLDSKRALEEGGVLSEGLGWVEGWRAKRVRVADKGQGLNRQLMEGALPGDRARGQLA
jgi:hypothetical protein